MKNLLYIAVMGAVTFAVRFLPQILIQKRICQILPLLRALCDAIGYDLSRDSPCHAKSHFRNRCPAGGTCCRVL